MLLLLLSRRFFVNPSFCLFSQHLNNCGQFRAVSSIPLPVEQDETISEADEAEDEFMALLREKEELAQARRSRDGRKQSPPALAPLAMLPEHSVYGRKSPIDPDSPADHGKFDDSDPEDDFSILSGAAEILQERSKVSISRPHSPSAAA